MKKIEKFAIYGAGSWGTALACHVARVKGISLLYARSSQVAEEINLRHTNNKYLGNTYLHQGICAFTDKQKLKEVDCIILAMPSYAFSNALHNFVMLDLDNNVPLLVAAKGMVSEPVQLFSDRIKSTLKNPFAFFSGPNFAREVANGQFSSATISCEDMQLADKLKVELETDNFEISICNDIITTQVAGVIKNIVAVKSGILEASKGGENARAWLVTKGLQEIAIVSRVLGGKAETLLEPAVIGDLLLTAYSKTSRNTKFGYEFYKYNYSKEFLNDYPYLIEGVEAAKLIKKLIHVSNFDLPIISSVINKL